jgi:uncharacterized protein
MKFWTIFENPIEGRPRAGWRILIIIVLVIAGLLFQAMLPIPHWLKYIATAILFTFIVWFTGRLVDNRPFTSFGLQLSPIWWRELWFGVIFASFVSITLFAIGAALGWYEIHGFGWQNGDYTRFFNKFALYLTMMICVGYYEELLFRGYLNLNLFEGFCGKNSKTSLKPAFFSIILISALFGIVHANNPNATIFGIINVFLAGLMLGIPFFATGRIAMSIGIHFAWNYVQGPILGLPVSGMTFSKSVLIVQSEGPAFLAGGRFGFEGGIIGFIGILLISLVVWWYLRRMGYTKMVHPAIQSQAMALRKEA